MTMSEKIALEIFCVVFYRNEYLKVTQKVKEHQVLLQKTEEDGQKKGKASKIDYFKCKICASEIISKINCNKPSIIICRLFFL
jgi:hypothetical protein